MHTSIDSAAIANDTRVRGRLGGGPRERVPIYVIGGFLGSGKTTLLKRLVQQAIAAGARPTVIMNEFSETNIDGALVHGHDGDGFDLRSILNGCVCCDLSRELTAEVRGVVQSTEGPIFVETTGLASVGRAAAAVMRAVAGGARRGRLASVIAVVDARRFRDLRRFGRDPRKEIGPADTVVINKIDGLPGRRVKLLEAGVRALNPDALILTGTYADVPLEELLEARRPDIRPGQRSEPQDEDQAVSSEGFVSVTANLLGPVSVARLARVLAKYERELVRVKGFVRMTDIGGLHEVQWAGGQLEVRSHGPANRAGAGLVMIGRDVDWDRFVVDLDRCVTTGASTQGRRS